MRFFINTVSREHVRRGIEGGFTQADHGRDARIKRLEKGDRIVFYSPRTEMDGGEPLQRFTAIAEIVDDAPYQVEIAPEFKPWRRRVTFADCEEVPIQPLIEQLEFIRNKKSWGFTFRRGFFEIAEADFRRIEEAMSTVSEAVAAT
jgi:hypothetical protein